MTPSPRVGAALVALSSLDRSRRIVIWPSIVRLARGGTGGGGGRRAVVAERERYQLSVQGTTFSSRILAPRRPSNVTR
jgi:hypothetical protein